MKKLNYVIWCAWRFKKRKKESFAWKRGHIFLFFNFDKLKVFFFDLWSVELRVRPRMLSYVAVFTITDTVDLRFPSESSTDLLVLSMKCSTCTGPGRCSLNGWESPNLWPLIWHSNIPFNVRKQTCGGNARTFARASENFFGSPRTTLITRASRSNPWPSIYKATTVHRRCSIWGTLLSSS